MPWRQLGRRVTIDLELLAAGLSRANVDGSSTEVTLARVQNTIRTIQTTNENRYLTVAGVALGLDTLYVARFIVSHWLSEN